MNSIKIKFASIEYELDFNSIQVACNAIQYFHLNGI
jgi:hypothetical protein